MKKLIQVLFLFFFISVCSYGQVTNLLVNGVGSNFTGVSGDQFTWAYDVPTAGDTTYIQIWVDTDNNGILNNSVDVIWQSFIQIDGDPKGHNGPPDMSNGADGHVSLQMSLGLAPAHYIMYFKNNNVIKLVAGQITALASPVFTISGRVTSGGSGMQYVVVNLDTENGNAFWTGITDANGDYSIKMNSDTSGNPWKVKIDNTIIFRPNVPTPDRYSLTLDQSVNTTYSGNDFVIENAAAHISGTLYNDAGEPYVGGEASITSSNGNFGRGMSVDSVGHFDLGLTASELPISNLNLGSGDSRDTTIVRAQHTFALVQSGNALTQDLYLFNTNSTITGRITLNGASPGYAMYLFAVNADTGQAETQTDNNGYFRFKVSTKIYNYQIAYTNDIVQNYNINNVVVHAGDSNVNIDLIPTDVKLTDSGIPSNYSLSQNYPNPFNPSTVINYEIPKVSRVTISVYNVLGQEITKLVNREQAAGKYSVDFNAEKLSSGIYFYKIQAGNFSSFKKMILMK